MESKDNFFLTLKDINGNSSNSIVNKLTKQNGLYYVKIVREPFILVAKLIRKVMTLGDWHYYFRHIDVGSL